MFNFLVCGSVWFACFFIEACCVLFDRYYMLERIIFTFLMWGTYSLFFGLFSFATWSLVFLLQVQMTCHYGVCNHNFSLLLFSSSLFKYDLMVHSFTHTAIDILGFVGELHPDKNSDNGKHVLYTHKSITIQYNKDQVWFFFNFSLFFCQGY